MTDYADLEIGLYRRDMDSYTIDMRFSQSKSDTDTRLLSTLPILSIDFDALRAASADSAQYGQLLTETLFADNDVQSAFEKAYTNAQVEGLALRLRLFIGPIATELHSLHWETLQYPRESRPLITGEQLFFSRYLSSQDWKPVGLRAESAMKALVVIANPTDLSTYQLAPINVADEISHVEQTLDTIKITTLAESGQATLRNLTPNLRDGFDILYLVCHGKFVRGEPQLWLEDETGSTARVSGYDLVTRLAELRIRPRLVVLASCQSAGTGEHTRSDDNGMLASLGPRLAEAGIPAVLAMQSNITFASITQFMPVFFKELQRDGQIDRAMAVARGAIRDRIDWWVPVLFMRLKTGRLWYTPGFAADRGSLEKWPALMRHIQRGRCTPILGPGLAESLLGDRRSIAQRWAETYNFPMAPHDQEDLPQVAQFLAINQDHMFPREELIAYLRHEIMQFYPDQLPAAFNDAPLDALISAIEIERRAKDPANPFQVLAELPLPIYITTSSSNIMATALAAMDKTPKIELCRWNEDVEQLPSIYDDDPTFRPEVSVPLVYHLYGHLQEPTSVVLTEDDYFDFLIGVTSNKEMIPAVVAASVC